MKKEYDLSKGERGKFYRKGAIHQLPIYLDAKVLAQVERIAEKKGMDITDVVNEVLKGELELLRKLT